MAAKAREENDALKARMAALEAKLAGTAEKPKAAPKRKGPKS
jgi:BMFP domain-containing protein YqiC